MSATRMPVLEIQGLSVAYRQGDRMLNAVRDVSLSIQEGQTLGIVGESGSGKTTLGLAVMGYLPDAGVITGGEIRFIGKNILKLARKAMREYWGKDISFVPQNALESLNPSMQIGDQVAEQVGSNLGLEKAQARKRTLELLEVVHMSNPERVANAYPFQLSAGMLQRVLIAMAISAGPRLLVLDEPTSNLDVTTQARILELIRELIAGHRRTSVLYISHNLGVVSQICDLVAVMYAGDLVELGSASSLFRKAVHPYTQALLDCVPRLGESKTGTRLHPIDGRIPAIGERPTGCVFRDRCPLSIELCERYPPLYQVDQTRQSRCHRWEGVVDGNLNTHQSGLEKGRTPGEGKYPREEAGPTLLIEGVSVHFPERRSWLGQLYMQPSPVVKAVNDVDLEVERGQVVGLVGESGSGKTTLANAISGLVARTEGDIRLLDETLPKGINQRSKDTLRAIQVVFQNPGEALNPYHSVGQALRRPLKRLREIPSDELEGAVAACLEAVNLPPEYAQRLPVQLSGGELQRLAIARAYAIFPEVLIADEPVSSLDVSVQASILNLFHNLQRNRNIGLLFISHDLAVVGYLADKVVVIYKGQVMEVSPISSAFDPPHHPYTEVLLSSIPVIGHTGVRTGEQIEERMTTTSDDTQGCPFHTRCPRSLGNVCGEQVPPWWEDRVTGKRIFCHLPIDELRADQKRRSDLIVPIDQG